LNEIDDALEQIRSQTGVQQFEIVGMDACLMGHIEVLSALARMPATLSSRKRPSLPWAGPIWPF